MDLGLYMARRPLARTCRDLAALAALVALPGAPSPASIPPPPTGAFTASPTLQRIQTRAELSVGVRTDFPPFGTLDAQGRPRGLEVDIAQRLASHLGVRLRLVPVTEQSRFVRLREGAVDLIIAAAADTPARRAGATAVEPHYYGSGVGVLLRPERRETDWSQLRGRTLCAVQGAAFNPLLMRRYQMQLQASPSVGEALRTLDAGRCDGLLYTDVAVHHLRKLPDWRAFQAPLAATWVMPWAISIALSERGTEFERELGDTLARWHREGALIALEKKWELKPSKFLQNAQDLWSARHPDESPVCAHDAQGRWPTVCRDPAFIDPLQAQGVLRLALWLRDSWGVPLAPAGDAYDGRRYGASLALTCSLATASLAGWWLAAGWGLRRLRARRDQA